MKVVISELIGLLWVDGEEIEGSVVGDEEGDCGGMSVIVMEEVGV